MLQSRESQVCQLAEGRVTCWGEVATGKHITALPDASPPGWQWEVDRPSRAGLALEGSLEEVAWNFPPRRAVEKHDTYPSGGWSYFPGFAHKATNILPGFACPTVNEFLCSLMNVLERKSKRERIPL